MTNEPKPEHELKPETSAPAEPSPPATETASKTPQPLTPTPNAIPADKLARHSRPPVGKPATRRDKPVAPKSAPSEPEKSTTTAQVEVDDASIEAEIEAALGDISLVDIYQMTGQEDARTASGKKAPAEKESSKGMDRTSQGICRGRVVAISPEDIFIDLGGKSQGVLPKDEIDPHEKIDVGQELDVCIVRYDARDGVLILSKKTADQRLIWNDLEVGSLVEARVTGHNKGGLELEMKGIRMFMPASQIATHRVEDLASMVGEKLVCEVTHAERGDRNVVVSRRNVMQREEEKLREKLWEDLAEGQRRKGIVRNLMDYGAFVDIGGADGLLHIREMSWARIKHPREILAEGQEVEVVVLSVDPEKRKISLSLKQTSGDPWATAAQTYAPGTRHTAQVMKLMDFGAFAELEPGVEGLIPISEMTWAGRVRHPSDVVKAGAQVEVEIIKMDPATRKISMSMKKVQSNPWENIADRYKAEQVLTGKVVRITDFGAFVTLEEGVDGLIHISELSHKRVAQVSDVVKEGQEVTVKVLEVDEGNGRIALSTKGLGEDAANAPADTPAPQTAGSSAGAQTAPTKSKSRPRRGGLGWDHMGNGGGLTIGG